MAYHVNNLADQFLSHGHQVKIIAPCSDVKEVPFEGFISMGRAVPLPAGGSIARVSLSLWLRRKVRQLMSEEQFDIVHIHEPGSGVINLCMLADAENFKSKYIGTFHTYESHKLYKIGGKRFFAKYYQRLDGRIAVSKAAHKFISKYFPEEYRIIPNGIQLQEFKDVSPFSHLKDGKINILFLGRLEKRKGLRYLLSAYSELRWKWPNLRLIVVGDGQLDADSYRIIGERNLSDVMFVGRVSEEEKVRYYHSADIFCSPASGGESFGIVLLEAMASGIPVVASDIDGYNEVLGSGEFGCLVPPKDEGALASTLDDLIKNTQARGDFVTAASKRVLEFSWDKVADRVMKYYLECLGNDS